MKSYKIDTMTMIGLMMLCFWLMLLFLDGRFSYIHIDDQADIIPQDILFTQENSVLSSGISMTTSMTAMVSGVVHQSLGNSQIFQDLNVLEYLYIKNKNPELLQPLVEKFLQYYQFDKANKYLVFLVQQEGDYFKLSMDPHQVLYALLHDSTVGLDNTNALNDIFALVQNYRARNLLTADDEMFYKGLKSLWVYDYATASAAFGKVTDPRYQDFKTSYESSLANYIKIKNPPAYYRDGLVSLTLLKNWYFSLAKRLALRALDQDQDYVLPYQVLAYANFLTHYREASKDYFLKLADFDTSNSSLYKFLIGISYYRYGDYDQSVLYLTQVTEAALQTDVYRYMLLSYIQWEDTVYMTRMWQNLLGQSDLQSSDFALFFDQIFYIPFRSARPFSLYLDNPQLVDLYLWKCSTLFSGSQADVCVYGEVWLQLAKQNLSSVGQKIISLTTTYHQSHLYHILGDYYSGLNQSAMAKQSYIKALSICDTTTEQEMLQNKIK